MESSKSGKKLLGPFSQLLTMKGLNLRGPVSDESMEVIQNAGVVSSDGYILETGLFESLKRKYPDAELDNTGEPTVGLPGLIDCHTHICFAGTRAADFAARNNGKSYLEIGRAGGGIWSTVKHTREADLETLIDLMKPRLEKMISQGITTAEVKSGYGLSVKDEIKMLQAIKDLNTTSQADLVPTCLAAHIVPRDFNGSAEDWLQVILRDIVPIVKEKQMCTRFDIFVEENAFSADIAGKFLNLIKGEGFDITVHGDQFSTGGSRVAVECDAVSVDHLEVSGPEEVAMIAGSNTAAVALPGASLGLGEPFAPARQLLDQGTILAIASDWNPGSAPMGNLLAQASIISTYEKLSAAEIFSALTFRAAHVLRLKDRGILVPGMLADICGFPTSDFREILYNQGSMQASMTWKKGVRQ